MARISYIFTSDNLGFRFAKGWVEGLVMKKRFALFFWMLTFLAAINGTLFAEGILAIYPGFPPINESRAYQQYRTRPISELSKIIYLIDRFSDTGVEILYDGHYFSAKFTSRVARWFLSRHYRGEAARKWILRWCNASVPAGNLIWVKLPDGRFKLAREVLSEELKNLEAVTVETPVSPDTTH